jgi:hypothetical protein
MLINWALYGDDFVPDYAASQRIAWHPSDSVRENIGSDFSPATIVSVKSQYYAQIRSDKIERLTPTHQRLDPVLPSFPFGFVSRRQVPAPEALARHRVPRVAS